MSDVSDVRDVSAGQFFLWGLCSGVLLVGVVVQLVLSDAKFYPSVMLSGALWTIANLMMPLVVRTLGLGIGLLVWSTSGMIVGWATNLFAHFLLSSTIFLLSSIYYLSLFTIFSFIVHFIVFSVGHLL